MIKKLIFVSLLALAGCAIAVAQTFNPPIPTININGHAYTNANWQANFWGTAAAIANDIGLITTQYPTGRFSPRVKLTADLIVYVATSGSDANSCLVNNPCATMQHAWEVLRDGYDISGHTVTMHLSDGSYSPGVLVDNKLVGQRGPENFIIDGNVSTPGNVVVSDVRTQSSLEESQSGVGIPIKGQYGAAFTIQGMRIVSAGSGVVAGPFSTVWFKAVDFGGGLNDITVQTSAAAACVGNYSISHSENTHVNSQAGGRFSCPSQTSSVTVTLNGSPNFAVAFVYVIKGGIVTFPAGSVTFSGGATGLRAICKYNAILNTNLGGPSFLPGSIAPTGDTGCQSI